MGQTQILFIVLSVLIVGAAVAIGVGKFGETAVETNKNAVLLDCQQVVARARTWYGKPAEKGGGGESFTGCTLQALGVAANNANTIEADQGPGFQLTVDSATQITVMGTGREMKKDGSGHVQVRMVYDALTGSTATTFP